MKALLIALALLDPANGASLGIGIDVLPEAFGFAARRVGFVADLRLTTCTASRCRWDLGDGVEIAADQTSGGLDIYRLEATLDRRSSASTVSANRYEMACLAIVALVQHDIDIADLRVVAKAISSPSRDATPVRIDSTDRAINVYSASAAERGDTRPIARRCGASAA